MNILMMTNTFTPHVGGVARSVQAFSEAYRQQGHEVMTIAPEFPNMPQEEESVLRVRAIRRFNHSDFSVRLPIPVHMQLVVDRFEPDIVHSHHPFMLGASALRLAHKNRIPIVYTHHTLYERYTHYVPGDSDALKSFVAEIATGYANLCDQVFAPSESLVEIIRERGVTTPVDVVPTGVEIERFEEGSGPGMRAVLGLPSDGYVIGHIGRLAPEKNLGFLAGCVCAYMQTDPGAHFLVVGSGPSLKDIEELFGREGLSGRLHAPGILTGAFLVSAYKAMDVFAFASQTETQGMVLTEAMAAGTPVVAVDASGAREVVDDGKNGYLLARENCNDFVAALTRFGTLAEARRTEMRQAALDTAQDFSMRACSAKGLRLYAQAIERGSIVRKEEGSPWKMAIDRVRTEWDLLANTAGALGSSLLPPARGV